MKKCLLASILALSLSAQAAPKVVSSIYPLQQIANAITGKTTGLVADSYLSPHDYAIKPSDARAISDADIFLWVGANMVPKLEHYAEKRDDHAITITASELDDMILLEGHHHHHHGEDDDDDHDHEAHDHEEHDTEHGHHDHDDHDGHEAAHEHEHEHEHEHDDHDHDKHDDHEDHDEHSHDFAYDPHLWLSTHNAEVIAKTLAKSLIQLDSANQTTYEQNLKHFLDDLQQTRSFIMGNFESKPAPKFFVFHNAYRYFEKEFGIEHLGLIRLHAAQTPKTRHLSDLKKQLTESGNACLFREPQFDSAIVDKLVDGTNVRVDTLDPVGYTSAKNGGYTTILKNISEKISHCY